jgi:hypothetical protein
MCGETSMYTVGYLLAFKRLGLGWSGGTSDFDKIS